MSSAKSSQRMRLLIMIALSIALALGSFWISQIMQKKLQESLPNAPRSAPDYYVENFNLVKMSVSGEARYTISGARLTHHPLDDSHTIEQPVLHSLGSGRPPMTMRANRARIENDNSQVHMLGQVKADRPATPTVRPLHLETEYLLVLPDDDIMKSDQPVRIKLGDSLLTGTGMIANNATRQLQVMRQAHLAFAAPAPAAPAVPAQ